METKQIVDSILENVRAEITAFVENEPKIQCPVEYELKVIEIAKLFSKNLILTSQGKIPGSRNLKKK
jgi:hypothetical protein